MINPNSLQLIYKGAERKIVLIQSSLFLGTLSRRLLLQWALGLRNTLLLIVLKII